MSEPNPADTLGRIPRDLRLSVTDRCNYRCTYCMPNEKYEWLARREILNFEEIERLVRIFAGLGVEKVRLTGGEPLVRRNVVDLVARLARVGGLHEVSLTTNGSLLAPLARSLKAAGLARLNVSLDTLRPERFLQITQRDDLQAVLDGVLAARDAGLTPVKINSVIVRGVNDDEVLELAGFCREHHFELRLIEYMDVGNANGWSLARTVRKSEMLQLLQARWPVREVGRTDQRAPAVDYEYCDGAGRVGIIGSVTEPFCGSCTRVRLTADGKLVTCLFAETGHDLKTLLRSGATDDQVGKAIAGLWRARTDRYSEARWEVLTSGGEYSPREHRKIEMIRLGG